MYIMWTNILCKGRQFEFLMLSGILELFQLIFQINTTVCVHVFTVVYTIWKWYKMNSSSLPLTVCDQSAIKSLTIPSFELMGNKKMHKVINMD